jgi:hypothetical protein
VAELEEWHPGSFTKNFSWGPESQGLKELHTIIRVGFDDQLTNVPRQVFRQRVKASGRPDYIPLNFFLYNETRNGADFLVVDELIFQALTFRHSAHFDRLAVFAFNLSRVGRWKGAAPYQGRPALWAFHYVADRVGSALDWDAAKVTADDIETFVANDSRYTGRTTRKLATNLNYLYKVGRLREYRSGKPERWWLSSLFLALDRTLNPDRLRIGTDARPLLNEQLTRSGFWHISGKRSMAKDIAALYFQTLYDACGGRARFSSKAVVERQNALVPQMRPNDPDPPTGAVGVFHATNPAARSAVPEVCEILARYSAGFETFDAENLDDFDVESFVRDSTKHALEELRAAGIRPSISSDELSELLRGE